MGTQDTALQTESACGSQTSVSCFFTVFVLVMIYRLYIHVHTENVQTLLQPQKSLPESLFSPLINTQREETRVCSHYLPSSAIFKTQQHGFGFYDFVHMQPFKGGFLGFPTRELSARW